MTCVWLIRVCCHGHRVEWRDKAQRWQHMDADIGYCTDFNPATVEVVNKPVLDAHREGFASEARIVLAQTLDVKALGKNRRRILTQQVLRAGVDNWDGYSEAFAILRGERD